MTTHMSEAAKYLQDNAPILNQTMISVSHFFGTNVAELEKQRALEKDIPIENITALLQANGLTLDEWKKDELQNQACINITTVSYTHLTLPTILRV